MTEQNEEEAKKIRKPALNRRSSNDAAKLDKNF